MRPAAAALVRLLAAEAARIALEREAAAENEMARTADKAERADGGQREQANNSATAD